MRKPDLLREWLLRAVPGLSDHPERLHIFTEEGRIACVRGATLSYRHSYQLILMVEDFGDATHSLIVPILAWLSKHQPELLDEKGSDGLPFAQDILDNKTADFEIKLDLSERALVTETEAGGWQVEYPDEPKIPDEFAGASGARLWRLYFDRGPQRDLVAVHPDHLP
jgi:hypothetical protein